MVINLKRISAILVIAVLVCCLIGSASAGTEERITNGDFSNGLTGWSVIRDLTVTGNNVYVQDGACHIQVQTSGANTDAVASISQSVDLTGVQYLTWKTSGVSKSEALTNTYVLSIYAGDIEISTYTWSQVQNTETKSYNVASLTGTYTVKFQVYAFGATEAVNAHLTLDDISAIATTTPPTVTELYFEVDGSEDTTPAYSTGSSAKVHYVFSTGVGSYANPVAYINWGDDSAREELDSDETAVYHTYSSPGIYSPTVQLYYNSALQRTYHIPNVYVISLDFTADKTSVDPGTAIVFTPSSTLPSDVEIASYSWNYGDGSGASVAQTHTYSSAGTYTVSLTATLTVGSGYTVTKTKTNYINAAAQTITFSQTQRESGQSVTVTWSLRDTNYPYNLNIYPAWNTGERSSYNAVQTHTISSASDTSFTFTTGSPNYYTAYIEKNGNEVVHTTTPLKVVTLISLTVNVYNNGISFTTNQSTVKLYNAAGVLQSTKTTTLGDYTVQFNDINTGSYYVTIEAQGQTLRTSPTMELTDSYTLNIDFTLGTSDTSISGVGAQYATTFITFRTVDKGTGKYISGVQITATAVQPTNAWEYFANLFGASLGTVIQSMTLNGISDSEGRVTFAMYQNVRYNLNITYYVNGQQYHEDRAFQQSTGTGEYKIDLPITDLSSKRLTEELVTDVNTTGDSIVTTFTDNSASVTSYTITVYEKDGDERKETNMTVTQTNPPIGIPQVNTFTPSDPSGHSYIVSFVIQSSIYGTKTQEYGVTFAGVAVKLGDIPNSWYIWISFIIMLMTGAVATFVNSRHFAIVLCIVATLLFFAGWLNALGTVAPVALVICYVLTIVYYIANHNGGGA